MIMHPEFDPVALRIGPLAVRWYGLMYLIGFLSGWMLGRRRAKRPGSGWTAEQVDDLITYCVLGVVAGGRIGYMLFYDFPGLIHDPLSLFAVWNGGMSFHGGVLGVFLVCLLFARKNDKALFEVGDFLAPLIPIGLFCGRIGNYINSELWGAPTDLPWGVIFPDPMAGSVPRHPSQLYEAGLEGVALFIILWGFSATKRPVGSVSGLFLLCYGIFRFAVEFVRIPDIQLGYLALGWLTMGQILSLPMILAGAWLIRRAYARKA